METVWDPLRKKEVALTPEERVRQWFIGVLNKDMKVPMHMMMSETALRMGDKNLRADIVVYGRNAAPVAVVECKRPETGLDGTVLDQAVRYNLVLGVRYIIITNGKRTFICKRNGQDSTSARYSFITDLPSYDEMAAPPSE